MTIRLSHAEAETVCRLKAAIGAMNALVIHLNAHPDTVPATVKSRVVEADFMLNTAEDHIINDDAEMLN